MAANTTQFSKHQGEAAPQLSSSQSNFFLKPLNEFIAHLRFEMRELWAYSGSLHEENTKLKEEQQQLHAEQQKLRAEKQKLHEQSKKLLRENKTLRKERAEFIQYEDELDQENCDLRKERDYYRDDYKKHEEEEAILRDERDAWKQKYHFLQEEYAHVEDSAKERIMESEVEERVLELNDTMSMSGSQYLCVEIAKQDARVKELEHSVKGWKDEAREANAAARAAEDEVSALKAKLRGQEGRNHDDAEKDFW